MTRTIQVLSSLAVAALIALHCSPAIAQTAATAKPFEGTVTCSMASPIMDSEKHEMIINLKPGHTELEIDAGMQGRIRMIEDGATKKTWVIMEAMEAGMTMDMSNDAPMAKDSKNYFPIKASGKKQTINGHAAEEWVGDMKNDGQMHFWLASDFPADLRANFLNALRISSTGGAKVRGLFDQVATKNMIPVRMSLQMNGKDQLVIDLLKIEAHSLDDKLFEVPKDIHFEALPAGSGLD